MKFKLRKNAIDHLHFNPSFDNAEGQRYFNRVYVPNQHELVPQIDNITDLTADDVPDNNLFDFIIERGFKNMIGKGTGVMSMRTGYNPGKLRRQALEIKREKRLSEQRHMMKQINDKALFAQFLELLSKQSQLAGQNLDEAQMEERRKFERHMQQVLRKFLPNSSTGSFAVMRQKIEKLVDDGFTFLKYDPALDRNLSPSEIKQEIVNKITKSPLELLFAERQR